MSIRLIEEHKSYRITEDRDEDLNMTHLKGDMFTLKCKEEMQPGKSEEEILAAEKAFEREVYEVGVFGYTLERWNPAVGAGWEHVDSCWGFVGPYSSDEDHKYNHYIVGELRERITEEFRETDPKVYKKV